MMPIILLLAFEPTDDPKPVVKKKVQITHVKEATSASSTPVVCINNNNNIFILNSAKSIYSSKRITNKMYNITSVKLIRNVKIIINIQVKNYATCS